MENRSDPPPISGTRMPWLDLPSEVGRRIEERFGLRIVNALDQEGGFSPGVAARLLFEDGSRAFIKAAGPELNPDTPGIYRREAEIVDAMPPAAPVPKFLWSLDCDDNGWVVLAFQDVDGRSPSIPWRPEELDRVLKALVDLFRTLTPAPFETTHASASIPSSIGGWGLLRDHPPPLLDKWSLRNLDRLARLEMDSSEAVAGNTLVHLDIRADNLLLTDDRVYVVDWPIAHIGAEWLDVVCFAPSVAIQGGPQPEDLLSMYPPTASVERSRIDAFICAVAGFFTQRALLPPPAGLPTVRAFQAAQGRVARQWLAQRTKWT